MTDHYWSWVRFPICNKHTKTIPPTLNAKIVGKPYSLSNVLHILKEKYTLLIILHLEACYFIYHLQTCISVRFAPPMLNARILIEDFGHMWKIQNREFWEYLTYNIFCGYIFFNDGRGYGILEHLTSCLGVYALQYCYKLKVTYITHIILSMWRLSITNPLFSWPE
jgi:hypothetical protein